MRKRGALAACFVEATIELLAFVANPAFGTSDQAGDIHLMFNPHDDAHHEQDRADPVITGKPFSHWNNECCQKG